MGLPFRRQLGYGAALFFALFLIALFFGSRATFQEQIGQLEEQSSIIAVSVVATAEAGHLDRETIARAIAKLPVPDDGLVAVEDVKTSTIVASRGPANVIASLDLPHLPALVTRPDVDGSNRAYASAWTSDRLCRVVVGLPRRMAVARILPIYRRNVLIAGWWYLLSFVGLFLLLARWIRSVKHLEAMATNVSGGDLRTPTEVPMATSELAHMQTTMAQMITRVRELQGQVVRQERLAAIGTLVSGVAHEISNPLQSILGSTEVIQARTDLPSDVRADLNVIQNESMRAGGIIRNLTRFTRQQPASPEPVRLTEIVEWLTDLWHRRLVEQGITLLVDDQSTRTTRAVATELQQVALNFLVNAEYAVLHSGQKDRRVAIRTRDTANGFVMLEVEDSGPGVAPEHDASVFLPFFTTKPVGEGTGLGLSVSFGIIQSHGGRIGYDRGAMGGARFYFEIPAT